MSDILVVEDDDFTRTNIMELLSESGHNLFTAVDGRQGIKAAYNILPDLIISDIMMPEKDGIEMLAELAKDPLTSDIPVIFLTAKSEPVDIRTGMRLGADDYLTKPYKAAELLEAVEARLKKRQISEEKLKTLAANIALTIPHEIRTQLVSILGFSQLIEGDKNIPEKEEVLEITDRIHHAGSRLSMTIRKYLIYSEIEYTFTNLKQLKRIRNAKSNSIKNILSESALRVSDRFSRNDDLKMNIEDSVLKISSTYLAYIVEELIENACRFSETGSVIELSGLRLNEDFYEFSVRDYGYGMTPDQMYRIGNILKPESKIHTEPGHQKSGSTVFGLAIAKGLAELHGGTFQISSKKNKQTTVKITLQLERQDQL